MKKSKKQLNYTQKNLSYREEATDHISKKVKGEVYERKNKIIPVGAAVSRIRI